MDSVLDTGLGPANLILQFLCSRLYEESARDLATLFTSCKAWARHGDDALTTMKFAYLQSFPAIARQWMDASNGSPFGAPFDNDGSARVAFLKACRTLHAANPNTRSMRRIEEYCTSCSSSGLILFEDPLEFFGVLRANASAHTKLGPTRVIVGPSFQTVDLSAPQLEGQFTLIPHNSESYERDDDSPSLLAVHPSAFTCGEDIAMAVIHKLPSRAVFGIDATLGRLLAGAPSKSGAPAPPWRHRLVKWAAEAVVPNGPYFVCEGFCEAMDPLSFTAPAGGGFYDAAAVRSYGKNLRMLMVRFQIEFRRREVVRTVEVGQREFVSFVGLRFSGVLDIKGTVFSLWGKGRKRRATVVAGGPVNASNESVRVGNTGP